MRIIIDMQGLQTLSRIRGIGYNMLLLALDIARSAGDHDVWLVLNAAFPESILDIRRAFAGLISDKRIRVFCSPTPIASNDPANAWRRNVAEKIHEHFIRSLKPDMLLLTQALLGGWSNNVVMAISPLSAEVKTGVFLLENNSSFLDAANSVDAAHYQWCMHRFQALSQGHLIITTSTALRLDLIKKLSLPNEQVLALEDLQKHADTNVTALRIINACHTIHQQHKQETNPVSVQEYRPRLAFISPLPPEKTGIADYSAELLPELAHYYDIELITDQPEISDLWPDAHFTIRSVAWFRQHPDRYERVLYHLGNNLAFHGHMFALLNEIPGIIVLHDFFLSHVMAGMETTGYQPQAWTEALFQSHGYAALQQRFQDSEFDKVIWRYPCNLGVLQAALGVIVHAKNSQRLAAQWIGEQAWMDWATIPLLRTPALALTREVARQALKLSKDSFIVCSFGMLGASKLNQRLLDAWLSSALAKNEQCLLIFVGENEGGDYGINLLKTIKKSGLKQRIIITGWIDAGSFRHYLAAADSAVQLRTLSRGETSAAVLDGMNYGLPTIVNANGAMADLPKDAVWKLPDEFTDAELVAALETLWQDGKHRKRLAVRARKMILTQHNPSICAQQYAHTIESLYQRAANNRHAVVKTIAALDQRPADNKALELAAKAVAATFPPEPAQRQLLIDVSSIARQDIKSGIERVVRSQLLELIKNPPLGFRVEPVYLTDQGSEWHYRYARSYICKMLGIEQANLFDAPIDISPGDVFYAPDFFPDAVIEAAKSGLYLQWQAVGVSISFLIHDLLPVQRPEFFPDGADITHAAWLTTIAESATRLICISNAVADELCLWMETHTPVRKNPLLIDVVHHGADINASAPSTGLPDDAKQMLDIISATPTFIMVGTLEPRKGHLQTLAAFERLWQQGQQVNLVIVGKEGWLSLPNNQRRTIPELVGKLRQHKELGQRLFWLEGISDEYLERLYAASACLIAPSEGEGFGLPLIEAAQHKLPIIARDIPVFREVAGDYAYYFNGKTATDLQQAITVWLKRYVANEQPLSDNMPCLTWAENAAQLGRLLSNTDQKSLDNLKGKSLLFKPRLYVDISVVYRDDFKTGIQRVVRAILSELLSRPPSGHTVCPVYLDNSAGMWNYYSVPAYSNEKAIAPISPRCGDVLLGLDLAGGYVVEAFRQGLYRQLMSAGMRVYFIVYDLLPVLAPQFFSAESTKGHEQWLNCIAQSDGVVCISKAVADEFNQWLNSINKPLSDYFSVNFFHLGADIAASDPSQGMPDDAETTLNLISLRPSFLMVGTLEPRKGHAQTLAAFEQLWQQGIDANLVIVGKQGWGIKTLADHMRQHPELDKRLFWLENISDQYLEQLYAASTCLIAASEGEGFGLPLIEAAQHKLPIIARNIPVFHEVAGDYAYYFQGLEVEALAQVIKAWLALYQQGAVPDSGGMAWLTWAQSAQQLLRQIIPTLMDLRQ